MSILEDYALDDGVADSEQIDRAAAVVEELEGLQKTVESHTEYTQETSNVIMRAADSFMKVAGIGADAKVVSDMQSHYSGSLKQIDMQSLSIAASNLWDKIINAIRSALQWVGDILKKMFARSKKIEAAHESLKEVVEKIESSGIKNPDKSIKINLSPDARYFFTRTLKEDSAHGMKESYKSMTQLEKKYKEWIKGDLSTDFFPPSIGSVAVALRAAKNYGGCSSERVGSSYVVVSPTTKGKPGKTAEEQRAWIAGTKVTSYHEEVADDPKMVRRGEIDIKARVATLTEHWKEVTKFQKFVEEFVDKCKSDVEDLSKATNPSDEDKAMLYRLKFIATGPATRYLALLLNAHIRASGELNSYAKKLGVETTVEEDK